jgi:hypothetical protein
MKHTILVALATLTLGILPMLAQQPVGAPITGSPIQYNPQPNVSIIAAQYLPTVPPGWTLNGVVPLVNNGQTIAVVQMFLYNPTTHQAAAWLVQQ